MNAFIYSVKSLFNRRTTFGGILLFFIRLGKEKGHRQVSFSLMFTYSAGLYDEPVC